MTTAQALVKFLDNQYVSFDGKETKFVDGIFTIFGHADSRFIKAKTSRAWHTLPPHLQNRIIAEK